MKKFKFVLIIAISLFPVWLWAKHVTPETARQVAETQVRSHSKLRNAPLQELELVFVKTAINTKAGAPVQANNAPADVLYYVFNAGESGFVIVSGDDMARPVLGYSHVGAYDPDNLPPNFVYYLDDFLAKEIEYAIANEKQQDEQTKKQWEAFHDGSAVSTRANVWPILETQWDQTPPYNDQCPNQSVTGCVATAMAQIMKHHEHPVSRTVTIPGYTTETEKWTIPAITGTTVYDWDNMATAINISSPSAQKNAISTLMYHYGVAVEMDYTTSASNAESRDAALALLQYFDYDESLGYLRRMFFSSQQWEALLSSEIDAGRPVYYAGSNYFYGHAFVCDGYEDIISERMFHINWGWGGSLDGYFATTALNPGYGMGPYNEDQEMIINIKPNIGSPKFYNILIRYQTSISTPKTTLSRGESFLVDAPLSNRGLFDFAGTAGIAIVDENDNIMEIIGERTIFNLGPEYFMSSPFDITCTVPVSTTPGNLLLRAVYKANDATQWTIATASPGYIDLLNLTIDDGPVIVHGVKILYNSNLTGTATSADRGEVFEVSALFVNRGYDSAGDYGIALVNDQDEMLEIIGIYYYASTVLRTDYAVELDIICGVSYAITPGDYKIRAIYRPVGENWSFIYAEVNNTDIIDFTVSDGTNNNSDDNLRFISRPGNFSATPNPVNQFSPLSVETLIYKNSPASSNTYFIGDLELGIYDYPSGTTLLDVIETKKVSIGNSTVNTFTFNTGSLNLPAGAYVLRLYQIHLDGTKQIVSDDGIFTNYLQLNVTASPLNVTAISPANGATDVPVEGQLIIAFDQEMNTSPGIGFASISGGIVSNESKIWSTDNKVCSIPYSGLAYNAICTLNISGFMDVAGNFMTPVMAGHSFRTGHPPVSTVTWAGKGTPSVWEDPSNWDAGRVPSPMDTVVIPVVRTHYPVLQNDVAVAAIRFKPGAQLGNQSKLIGKAFVQYDLSKRNRWNMLSMPLREAYPSDFTFGGYPFTWICTFETSSGEGGVTMGDWSVSFGKELPLTAGDGFVLWLNDDDEYPIDKFPSDIAQKGLKLSDDVHELPFFHRHFTEDPDYTRYQMMHPAHDFLESDGFPGILGFSIFYEFAFENNVFQRIPDSDYWAVRSDNAYRLAAGNVNKILDFGTNHEAGGIVAFVGNPYMAGLDFEALYPENSSEIKPAYQIWTGNGYSVFTLHGYAGNLIATPDMTGLIAPLQAFLVEKAETSTTGSLLFKESMTSVTAPGITLRSSARTGNKLDIIARTPEAGILTFIARREGGQETLGNLDARKILNGISDLPEVYTLKPHKGSRVAAAVNIIDSDDLLIPVGLATGYTGAITLTFRGMDTYDANIFLIDAETNRTVDLTGLTSYEYVVDYTPKKVNGQTTVCEDRISIRISPATTGLPTIADGKVTVYAENGMIRVISGQSDPIREVAVYNLQGMMMYSASAINASACTVGIKWPAGVYVVKVITENTVENVKIIIQ